MAVVTAAQILGFLSEQQIRFTYRGDTEQAVNGYSSLSNYQAGTVTWVRSVEKAQSCKTGENVALIVVQEGVQFPSRNQIVTDESKWAFFSIAEHFFTERPRTAGNISRSAYLAPAVRLGQGVTIGPGAVLDGEIEIGDGTEIGPNVTVMNRVKVGANCVIQAGCVIGLDGYAFAERKDGRRSMIRHRGGVVIEDDVWIGANSNIARGTIDDTVIRKNAKIDVLTHIAHNVTVGENAAIVAHSTIMGSVQIGQNAYISTSTIRDQAHIGEGSFVAMGSIVTKDVPDYTMVAGLPASVIKKWRGGDG